MAASVLNAPGAVERALPGFVSQKRFSFGLDQKPESVVATVAVRQRRGSAATAASCLTCRRTAAMRRRLFTGIMSGAIPSDLKVCS